VSNEAALDILPERKDCVERNIYGNKSSLMAWLTHKMTYFGQKLVILKDEASKASYLKEGFFHPWNKIFLDYPLTSN